MSSEVKANKLSPATGTDVTLGDSSDTFTVPSGATLDVSSATMTGFTIPSGQTLTVASGGTITNSGTATGFGGDNTPSFAAHRTSSQSIANDTATKVQCDVVLWDTDSAYDNSTNFRFTVPVGGAGKYSVTWAACMRYIDSGEVTWAAIYKNGSTSGIGPYTFYSPGTNQGPSISSTWIFDLADSDYLELYIFHNEGSTENLLDNDAFFSAYKLIGV
jgi:hypothetical protein